jgi:hypothetical protein
VKSFLYGLSLISLGQVLNVFAISIVSISVFSCEASSGLQGSVTPPSIRISAEDRGPEPAGESVPCLCSGAGVI